MCCSMSSGSKLGSPTNVIVKGCDSSGPCVLHKGVNASFGVDFKSSMFTFLLLYTVKNYKVIQHSLHYNTVDWWKVQLNPSQSGTLLNNAVVMYFFSCHQFC